MTRARQEWTPRLNYCKATSLNVSPGDVSATKRKVHQGEGNNRSPRRDHTTIPAPQTNLRTFCARCAECTGASFWEKISTVSGYPPLRTQRRILGGATKNTCGQQVSQTGRESRKIREGGGGEPQGRYSVNTTDFGAKSDTRFIGRASH